VLAWILFFFAFSGRVFILDEKHGFPNIESQERPT
jgi:hypothetical protein